MPSTTKNKRFSSAPLLPALAFELRRVAFRLRITKTEVPDEAPTFRHIEHFVDVTWRENRDPAHSYAVGACREPHRMDRGDHRIFCHLGHRSASQAVSNRGRLLGKDRQLARSLLESGQLELGILSRQIARIRLQ